MNELKELLLKVKSSNSEDVEYALTSLSRQTKSSDSVYILIDKLNGFDVLYNLLIMKSHFVHYEKVLSIFANCTNLECKWRKTFLAKDGINLLVEHLNDCKDDNIVSRIVRLIANISKDVKCLYQIQQNKFIIHSLIKYGCGSHVKCQHSCLRALRIICVSKNSTKTAVENEQFPSLLLSLNSTSNEILVLCLRLICEMLKTQLIEMCYRVIENEVLSKIIQLANTDDRSIKDICLEILYLLTLNSSCRVTVAMEGTIEIFVNRIKLNESNEDTYKYAVRGLCLCSREAVSRNKMKLSGALPLLVTVLQQEDCYEFRETIVASFVWFLFDDISLGLLIRANVIPALLKYLDYLTTIEYTMCLQDEKESAVKTDDDGDDVLINDGAFYPKDGQVMMVNKDLVAQMPLSNSISLSYHESSQTVQQQEPLLDMSLYHHQQQQLMYSSPESSPYYPNSPQYSLPSFSPHMSPSYSPPTSPASNMQLSPEHYGDGYFSDTNTNDSSSSIKKVPYHFQSADGIHAMIHGTRGPIHDTLLLLSRFSQAKDPSPFFLFLPGFNSLLNYLLLVEKPNQKCARILNRLTLNSHCFDIMLKMKLIPRLYLRLCTGYSLEHLASLLKTAKEDYILCHTVQTSDFNITQDAVMNSIKIDKIGDKVSHESKVLYENEATNEHEVSHDNTFQFVKPTPATLSLGKLLISNLRSLCESSYGKGVLSHILLTGSTELKDKCVLSIPFMIWSSKLQKRIFLDLKAAEILCSLLSSLCSADNTTFILIIEGICALARSVVNLENADHKTSVSLFDAVKVASEETVEYEPPRKKTKENPTISTPCYVSFMLPSGYRIKCNRDLIIKKSLLFERMLSRRFIDADQPYVTISDVNEVAFVKMLHYLHGCVVHINSSNVNCDGVCIFNKRSAPVERNFESNLSDSLAKDLFGKSAAMPSKKKFNDCFTDINEVTTLDSFTLNKSSLGSSFDIASVYNKNEDMETDIAIQSNDNITSMHCSSPLPTEMEAVTKHLSSISNNLITSSCVSHASYLYACAERFFVNSLKDSCEMFLIESITEATLLETLLLAFRHGEKTLLTHCLTYLLTRISSPKDRVQYFTEILYTHERGEFLLFLKEFLIEKISSRERR